jgi:hypothetical protein
MKKIVNEIIEMTIKEIKKEKTRNQILEPIVNIVLEKTSPFIIGFALFLVTIFLILATILFLLITSNAVTK